MTGRIKKVKMIRLNGVQRADRLERVQVKSQEKYCMRSTKGERKHTVYLFHETRRTGVWIFCAAFET